MNKIVGFLISKENRLPEIDFFNSGLKFLHLKNDFYNIFLWGIGDMELCKKDYQYSLSFPLTFDLLDRNIVISLKGNTIVIENDWLSSIPVFYNPKEKIVSSLSNLCLKDKTINDEGLSNFCEFGYSMFEHTMFKDVNFMRHYSKLTIRDEIHIDYKQDPVLDSSFCNQEVDENLVIGLMQEYVNKVENSLDGDIVLPTSGGNDSRILNYLISNKNRIKSFTYGVSKNQSKSTEVIYAKKISEIFKTKWHQIQLSNYHNYIDDWFKLYGFSTHLHGMYHIEFFKKILKNLFKNPTVLTGIVGDAWAESNQFNKNIDSYDDVISLGYTHGMSLDCEALNFHYEDSAKKKYFNEYKKYFNNDSIVAILAIRNKLMMLSFLHQLPEYFGLPVWTPFLNYEIVRATLNIPDVRRRNRIWQTDFFSSVGLNLEEMKLEEDLRPHITSTIILDEKVGLSL